MLKKNILVTGPMFSGVNHVADFLGQVYGVLPISISKATLTDSTSKLSADAEPRLCYGVFNASFAEHAEDYDVILVRREPRDVLVSAAEGLARSRGEALRLVAETLRPMTTQERILAVLAGMKAARFPPFERQLFGWYEWLLAGATPVAYEDLFEKKGRAEIARSLRLSTAQVERAAAEVLPKIEKDWWNVPDAWKDKFNIDVSAAYGSIAFKAEGQMSVIPPMRRHKGKMQIVRAF